MQRPFILAIDQGTTGSRVFAMDSQGKSLGFLYKEHRQYYPQPGWVEHDALEIWNHVEELISGLLQQNSLEAGECLGIGITNQRETIVVWDRQSGKPLHPAIVWQCRRTSQRCAELKAQDREAIFHEKTGLYLDPYFSATKLEWIWQRLSQSDQKRALAGTIDSWLLYKLSGGKSHKTDYSNAARTMLFDIRTKTWDHELCRMLQIPLEILPESTPMVHPFGVTAGMRSLPDGVPILGMAGDQQAALFGQGCVLPGQAKNTYGTGAFLLMNMGTQFRLSRQGLLTTIGCDSSGNAAYVLEGSVFIAGSVMKWLRDYLDILPDVSQSQQISYSLGEKRRELFFVPAFAGLGTPFWRPEVRAALFGLHQDSSRADIIRAALEGIALQSCDLVRAMEADSGLPLAGLRVDGGASANTYLMQFQADTLNLSVELPENRETTVLGAALLCGIGAGVWNAQSAQSLNPVVQRFEPAMQAEERDRLMRRWRQAVQAAILFSQD